MEYWKTWEGDDPGGEGTVKCLTGHSPTFVTVHKVKRTGDAGG